MAELEVWNLLSEDYRIEWPGLYEGIPDDVYHAGRNTPERALSQSVLKALIPPSTPAHFKWQLAHGLEPRRAFDVGRAAHTMALGIGEPMVGCPPDLLAINGAMSTKASKEWAAQQRAEGRVPLTPADYEMVCRMAEALLDNPRIAEVITAPDNHPEVSGYAIEPQTGLWLRGRFDLLGGRIWDYKTTKCAEPEAFARSVWAYGYHVQDATYRLIYELLVGADPGPLVFMAQEKEPPYLASTVDVSDTYSRVGRDQLLAALDLYVACRDAGVWPGYPDEIITLDPPAWALRDVESAEESAAASDVLAALEGILNDQ